MNVVKALRIAALCVGIFGLIFVATGVGIYIGLHRPETRDLRIAQNENYPMHTAIVTNYAQTNTTVNNERMYRVTFAWDGLTAQTGARYTQRQAQALVGTNLMIRVNHEGRAVPANFERTVLSTLGNVFLFTFGGIGVVAWVVAIILFTVARRKKRLNGEDLNVYRTF
ncbi:MAG: hypothetical protein FWC71_04450 [Defluviitaleaceae bacterium]|nr:hypothetical protein [Defluviitaleaceae bacterium]